MTGQQGPAPVRVLVVDVEAPMPAIEAERPGGGRYDSARVFATRNGRLLAEVRLPLHGRRLGPDELRERLRDLPEPDWPAPPVQAPEGALPLVTVVVPTLFTRREPLCRLLSALAAQDYPRYQILLVDNRPEESAVPDWVRGAGGAGPRILAQRRPGTSAARNLGLDQAAGEFVAFTDDDVVVGAGWLRALVHRFLGEPGIDCVTGPVLPAELETPAQIWFEDSGAGPERLFRRATFRIRGDGFTVADQWAPDPHRPASLYALGPFGTGCNMAFRTSALRELGGFDEALGPGTPARAGEDILLFVRLLAAGRGLAVEPAAYVQHRHRPEYAELRSQVAGYGVGFTAMLTAAIWADRRHLRGLLAASRPAAAALGRRRGQKHNGRPDGYPDELSRIRLRGMINGPFAYLTGRRRMRRWRR